MSQLRPTNILTGYFGCSLSVVDWGETYMTSISFPAWSESSWGRVACFWCWVIFGSLWCLITLCIASLALALDQQQQQQKKKKHCCTCIRHCIGEALVWVVVVAIIFSLSIDVLIILLSTLACWFLSIGCEMRWDDLVLIDAQQQLKKRNVAWLLEVLVLVFESQAPPPCAIASDSTCRIFTYFLKNLGCQSFPPNWDSGVIFIATLHFWTHPFIHYHFLCDVPLFVVILSLMVFCYSKSFLPLRDRYQWFLFSQMCPRIRTKTCL